MASAADTPTPPENDPSIDDDVGLHRIVNRIHIVPDDNIGRWRPSSQAFQKGTQNRIKTNRMSIRLDDVLKYQFRSADEFVDDAHSIGTLTAGYVRNACDQGVVRSPTVDDDAHGDVVGPEKKSLRTKMAREAVCIEGDWERARHPLGSVS